ncbi:MAG: dienelactone hydrolase family protein [Gemmatimonadetes bacterium]|nr:dienelactone hydrolase family protein [Gemmatimonadota bacterium]
MRHLLVWSATAVVTLAGCTRSPQDGPAGVAGRVSTTAPSAESANTRLASSTRHGEWAVVPAGQGDSVRAWVVYPERADRAPVVLVVHEIFGVSNWIRSVADGLAAEGFIAIAPDLLTGKGVPSDSAGEPVRDAATRTIQGLNAQEVDRRLRAVARWGMALPAATDRFGLVGFCWGGSTVFSQAARDPEVDAVVVYYGSSPAATVLQNVRAPVLGLYGANDARVNATIPPADSAMKSMRKTFETRIYEGAGHGFLRQQTGATDGNRLAAEKAWPETIAWFRRYL